MSLIGKLLALFNLFGITTLLVFGSWDYARRQAGAYAVLKADLVLTGLPVDADTVDKRGVPVVSKLSPKTLGDLFSGVPGGPVSTQLEEVDRVQAEVEKRIDARNKDVSHQSYVMARALVPLSDGYIAREHALACRAWLANDKTLADFKARYKQAFDAALARADRPFEEAFRYAVRTQPGEPSDAFTTLMLEQMPGNRDDIKKLRFDDVFTRAMEAQRQVLRSRLDDRFGRAKVGTFRALASKGQLEGGDKDWRAFQDGYRQAFEAALAQPGDREKFNEAFTAEVAGKGVKNADSDAFTAFFLTRLPGDREALKKVKFDSAFWSAVEAFQAGGAQRVAIARLLFGLCTFLADDGQQGPDAESAAAAQKLIGTPAYNQNVQRVYVVCGLPMTLAAIAEEAAVLRRLVAHVDRARSEEQVAFVSDNAYQIEEMRNRAEQVVAEQARLDENKAKLTAQRELVKKRQLEVETLASELKASRASTTEKAAELRNLSAEVLAERVKLRDAIRQIEEKEKKIRELEAFIRSHERK